MRGITHALLILLSSLSTDSTSVAIRLMSTARNPLNSSFYAQRPGHSYIRSRGTSSFPTRPRGHIKLSSSRRIVQASIGSARKTYIKSSFYGTCTSRAVFRVRGTFPRLACNSTSYPVQPTRKRMQSKGPAASTKLL